MFNFSLPAAELRVLPDLTALNRSVVHEFTRAALDAVTARGRFAVALAGGSTPRAMYELLAVGRRHGHPKLPWSRLHFFFGDERAVPPDHPESNFRMASEALLAHVPVPAANVHRIHAELEPARAAEDYEADLRRFFALSLHGLPRFDLILLGLGADGHTASLFAGSPALRETRRLVTAHPASQSRAARLTLTLPVLNAAAEVLFVVSGADKAPVVRAVLHGPARRPALPAQRVRPDKGRLLWLLDEAAASGLTARAG
jgi:6-phosphogluconolactonase